MPISNHELLAKVERLQARVEQLERLEISPADLQEHLERLKRLESFMECIESYLDRLERLSEPLSLLEERLDRLDPRPPRKPGPRDLSNLANLKLVQSKVEVRTFLAHLSNATPQGFSLSRWLARCLWSIRHLWRR